MRSWFYSGVVCAVLGGAGIAAVVAAEVPAKPNIIFVLADDLGYGDLGSYGQREIRTPHLDRMAAEGLRFTQCYAGSTVCAPSRCSLMVGQHTGHCFVRGNARIPLRPEDMTVAEILQSAGYRTALVGKWGLGEPDTTGIPNRQGFDFFFGYLNQRHAHNYWPEYLWRNGQKVYLEGNAAKDGVSYERTHYSHDLMTEEALQFIERSKEDPFFLYLAYTIPHANNEAREKGMEVPDDAPYSDKPWPQPQKNHAAMITRMDRDVGRLFETLKQLEIDEETIVFFTSDNGPHREGGGDERFFNSAGPLRGLKRDLYEGGIRVPMIVRWPGVITNGQVSDFVWAFWDFLPTAAVLAGAEPPPESDGLSVMPTLLGRPQEGHTFLYWEFHERGFKQAVRCGDYKAVRLRPGGPLELYDLRTDLGETTDLAAHRPAVVARIEKYLATARTVSEHWPVKSTSP